VWRPTVVVMPFFRKSGNKNAVSSTHYDVLEVGQTASIDEIKEARKRLAKEWHPDKNQDNLTASNLKQQQINEAYRILGDDDLRRDYDAKLKRRETGGEPFSKSKFAYRINRKHSPIGFPRSHVCRSEKLACSVFVS